MMSQRYIHYGPDQVHLLVCRTLSARTQRAPRLMGNSAPTAGDERIMRVQELFKFTKGDINMFWNCFKKYDKECGPRARGLPL